MALFPEQNPFPVVCIDADGNFLYTNKAAQTIKRWFLSKKDKKIIRICKEVLHNGHAFQDEIYVDGKYYLFNFVPIAGKDYLNIYAFDITERIRRERQLLKARKKAEESKRAKEHFLSNMSHEIRTPLNGMTGILHLLESTDLNGEQQEYLDMLQTTSQHLLQLINEILDFSEIKKNVIETQNEPFDMVEVIDESLKTVRENAREKGIELKTDGLNVFQKPLKGNKARIRQILQHLLTNAVKFTAEGHIKLTCSAIEEDAESLVFSIAVEDTGIGIKKEDIPAIFDTFNRIRNTDSAMYQGTGLGLSIVQALIQQMGGSIEVESNYGNGSRFSITLKLPYAREKNSLHKTPSDSSETKQLNGYRALVVDDNQINRLIMERILSNWNVEVTSAENGSEALTFLETADFNIVLMDVQMPVLNGIDAAMRIRNSDTSYSSIPILAMTAASLPEQKRKCLKAGMNGYICKPYDPDKLFKQLKFHLKKSNSMSKNSTGNSSFSLDYLNQVAEGNEEFIKELIEIILKDMPQFVHDLKEAFEQKDFERISQIAHKAKSMASYVMAEDLREQFIQLEKAAKNRSDEEAVQNFIRDIEPRIDEIVAEIKNHYE